MVELNLGTNQIAKLPDDIAHLQNLEVTYFYHFALKFGNKTQPSNIFHSIGSYFIQQPTTEIAHRNRTTSKITSSRPGRKQA